MTEPDWNAGWPELQDGGKAVVILTKDGQTFEGVLSVGEFVEAGDYEYPLWDLTDSSGKTIDFAGAEKWRFKD